MNWGSGHLVCMLGKKYFVLASLLVLSCGVENNVDPIGGLGDYDPVVATTDVSILYPLPVENESQDFILPTEVGDHGQLLPFALYETSGMSDEDLDQVHNAGYPELRLIALRLDPCSASGGTGCQNEVRVIFQPVYEFSGELLAADAGVHVFYRMSRHELMTFLVEILALKKANGNIESGTLGPHPILVEQGLGGNFAKGLRKVVLSHLGSDRIARVTFMRRATNIESELWFFTTHERVGDSLVEGPIAGLGTLRLQDIAGDDPKKAAPGAGGIQRPSDKIDQVNELIFPRVPLAEVTEEMRDAFDSAIRIENPDVHNSESIDCGNCHLAAGARFKGENYAGFQPTSEEFTHSRDLSSVRINQHVMNLHAFSYLEKTPSVMQRTANESAIVAQAMQDLLNE